MPNYKRSDYGRTYFFTVVTYNRTPLFRDAAAIDLLRDVIRDVRLARPFDIDAIVVLPDHVHCIGSLPAGDVDYSKRWGMIKAGFTRHAVQIPKRVTPQKAPRVKRHEGENWQRRFWEHQIRDDRDYQSHCDYIHYNPVKHGLVKEPKAWCYSSFHQFVYNGFYDVDWGSQKQITFSQDIGNE